MNNLSWFLYLAEVVGNIQGLMIALAIAAGIAACIFGIIFITYMADNDSAPEGVAKWGLRLIVTCLTAAFIATLIPSQRTMYLIAASEAGEAVATSETGQKTIAAINRYLDSIGREEKKED